LAETAIQGYRGKCSRYVFKLKIVFVIVYGSLIVKFMVNLMDKKVGDFAYIY